MVYEPGAFEANLAAAADGDPLVQAELRAVYATSVARQIDLLERSRCDGNWFVCAQRLKGLAASFDSGELNSLAEAALECAPGEPGILRNIRAYLARHECSGIDTD